MVSDSDSEASRAVCHAEGHVSECWLARPCQSGQWARLTRAESLVRETDSIASVALNEGMRLSALRSVEWMVR